MTAKKTPAKAATAPAPAPGKSANYEATLTALGKTHHSYSNACRVVAFAYNGKCITTAERDALICYVFAFYNKLPAKVIDDVNALDSAYVKEHEEYKRMKESG